MNSDSSTFVPNRNYGIMMAVFTGSLWAILAILLKMCLNYLDSYSIAGFRLLFAFSFLFIVKAIREPQELKILKSPPLAGILAAVGLGLNYLLYMKGVELTSPSNAQVLIQLAPFALLISGFVLFKERFNKFQYAGFFVSLIGFALFYKDQLLHLSLPSAQALSSDAQLTNQIASNLETQAQLKNLNIGNSWLVVASLCWTVFAILQKKLLKNYKAQTLNLLLYAFAGLLLVPFIHWEKFMALPVIGWVLLIACGMNTILAYGALPIAFKHIPASQVSVIIATNPLLTILSMSVLASFEAVLPIKGLPHESISWLGYLAAILVVTGVMIVLLTQNKVALSKK